jgi:hypothetical protein
MKAIQDQHGLVEITLRHEVYDRLRGVLRRYTLCEETDADSMWLERFLDDLDRRDAEDLGVN